MKLLNYYLQTYDILIINVLIKHQCKNFKIQLQHVK